jgi:hypothetical protein
MARLGTTDCRHTAMLVPGNSALRRLVQRWVPPPANRTSGHNQAPGHRRGRTRTRFPAERTPLLLYAALGGGVVTHSTEEPRTIAWPAPNTTAPVFASRPTGSKCTLRVASWATTYKRPVAVSRTGVLVMPRLGPRLLHSAPEEVVSVFASGWANTAPSTGCCQCRPTDVKGVWSGSTLDRCASCAWVVTYRSVPLRSTAWPARPAAGSNTPGQRKTTQEYQLPFGVQPSECPLLERAQPPGRRRRRPLSAHIRPEWYRQASSRSVPAGHGERTVR